MQVHMQNPFSALLCGENHAHVYRTQVTVAASPPFGGAQIDRLQLDSQVYLTPGFQVHSTPTLTVYLLCMSQTHKCISLSLCEFVPFL